MVGRFWSFPAITIPAPRQDTVHRAKWPDGPLIRMDSSHAHAHRPIPDCLGCHTQSIHGDGEPLAPFRRQTLRHKNGWSRCRIVFSWRSSVAIKGKSVRTWRGHKFRADARLEGIEGRLGHYLPPPRTMTVPKTPRLHPSSRPVMSIVCSRTGIGGFARGSLRPATPEPK